MLEWWKPYFKITCLFYLFEGGRDLYLLVYSPDAHNSWSQEPWTQSRPSIWVSETQVLEQSPAASQGTYDQEAWIGNRAGAKTQALQCRMWASQLVSQLAPQTPAPGEALYWPVPGQEACPLVWVCLVLMACTFLYLTARIHLQSCVWLPAVSWPRGLLLQPTGVSSLKSLFVSCFWVQPFIHSLIHWTHIYWMPSTHSNDCF